MAELLLDVKNLVTEFKTENGLVKAVDDVSFQVNKGEVIGIVGESGSGKSVTSLSIMPLDSESSGKNYRRTNQLLPRRKNTDRFSADSR